MIFVPAERLGLGGDKAGSFDLLRFMECIHAARGHLRPAEAAVLMALVMRCWTKGTMKVAQRYLRWQTGCSDRGLRNILTRFEAEGLIERIKRPNRTDIISLADSELLSAAEQNFHDKIDLAHWLDSPPQPECIRTNSEPTECVPDTSHPNMSGAATPVVPNPVADIPGPARPGATTPQAVTPGPATPRATTPTATMRNATTPDPGAAYECDEELENQLRAILDEDES